MAEGEADMAAVAESGTPCDSSWAEYLADAWAKVRERARRLRAMADRLDAHADEWEAIIRARGLPLA